MISSIEKRKEQEEYLQRLHIGLQAAAIIKALGAAFDKKDINMDELIGKAPGEEKIKAEPNVDEWKDNANKRGLRVKN